MSAEPAIRDGPSLGRKRRESRDDRKLRTSRPGGLWLFTHSAATPAGDRPHVKRKTPLPGKSGASGRDMSPVSDGGPDPRNQPLGRGVTVTDWRLYTADHRQLDGVAGTPLVDRLP